MFAKRLLPILLVFGSVAFVVFLFLSRPAPPKKNLGKPVISVDVMNIEQVTTNTVIHSQGTVSPSIETTLTTEVSGAVIEVSDSFVTGGTFSTGDILIKIDPSDYQVNLKQAKAKLASALAQLAQEEARSKQAAIDWKALSEKGKQASALVLREPFLEEARANVKSAEADLERAQQKLDRTIIKAPYNGMIMDKRVDLGQYVTVGSQIAKIFSTDTAEVRLPITDHDFAFLTTDLSISGVKDIPVTLNIGRGPIIHQWKSRIIRSEGVVDDKTRVHYVVAEIVDPYLIYSNQSKSNRIPMKIGSFVSAKVKGRVLENVYKIPRGSMLNTRSVYVVTPKNQLNRRDIDVVYSDVDFVYASSGIKPGERLCLTTLEAPVLGGEVQVASVNSSEKKLSELVKKQQSTIKEPL